MLLHHRTAKLPDWCLSAICLIFILWLTLSPRPLGNTDLNLFFGADKVAHVIMFMGLTFCFLFDAMRHNGWQKLSLTVISIWSIVSMMTGILTEYLQFVMNVGRCLEFPDMISDAFGAIGGGALWIIIGNFIRLTDIEIKEKEERKIKGTSDIE